MKTQQEIEKEFDEKFSWIGRFYDESVCKYWIDEEKVNQVKSFLYKIRQDDIENLIEWTENKKRVPTKVLESQGIKDRQGYDQAFDEIIYYLKSLLKKEE
jgi:hypothetical protein